MKLKFAAILAAWLSIAPIFLLAQTGFSLSGKITGTNQQPLDGATVYLLNGADSVLLKTALADAKGEYKFVNLKTGSYKLSVSTVGYKSYRSAVFQLVGDKVMQAIVLEALGTALKEVSITAQRPFVQQLIDRTVISPEALISNAGGTALDVLEKSPGVLVDQNGAVTLKGKGVTIFIDDKPTYLSGAELESYLRSLNASAIDQVELMPNPPAKYDAAGNGGVINIRTKKSKLRGFNGSLNLAYARGRYGRTNNSLNFNYRNNQLNVFGNLNYGHNSGFSDLDIYRHFQDANGVVTSNFAQNSYIKRASDTYLAKVGADYYLNEKSTLGVNFTGITNPSSNTTPVTSLFTNAANQLDSTILADNRQHNTFRNGGANLNYRYQIDKSGHELAVDADYLDYKTNANQSFNNSSFLPDGTLVKNEILTGMLPAHIKIWSGKVDYSRPLKNGLKLAAGAKTSYTNTDNIADYFYKTNGTMVPDYGKTNHFIYKENINAAYLNANKDFKRLSIQAGLRLENTVSDGHQLGNVQKPDSSFKRHYTNLFPTVYLLYKLDTADRNQFSINYGRRIDRPYYQDLNPFLSPLDKFTYYTGNPFLRPTFTDNIELSHIFKNRFTTTVSYSRSRDDVNETIEIVDGIYYSRPGNIGRYTVKQISFNASFDPTKWFNLNFDGRVTNVHSVSDFYTGLLDTKGTYYFVRQVSTFKTGKDWSLQLESGYQSKITNAQFILGSRGRVNVSASKKFGANLTLKMVANDIFYTFKNTGIINNLANTKANWTNLGDTRTGVISLSYRFGKAISGQRNHDANGAEDEKNRVKN
ncbi:TonB-dependent receptor [Mucilaginibacter pedocola]|uniref:Outer membrane protein beta-barrel domain-containing protein n=1 Tax=Mucilaginibacter pedocola TaxID=1792845 RepID=A0A1S9PKU6_9SPHI|nr:TonB-dependent receptor [Mucilaginibacter pedocola]OOQ61592.1 hypothetical protein BC343_00505 [Mucilaginibacter pedocola]